MLPAAATIPMSHHVLKAHGLAVRALRSRFADCARHFFIAFGVVGGTEKTAVVDILRVEIQRLADQSQVVFPALRQRAEKMPAGRYPGILSAPRERSLHPIARITAFAWI